MFGFIFIYWIWKAFSNLALGYNKNKWTYFFIGLGSYYGITIASAFIYVIIIGITNGFDALGDDKYYSSVLDIVFAILGGLGCYAIYKHLESKGQKERELIEEEGIDSIGLIDEN
ncbi:hypothetical protein C8C83_2364 [Flavobacterium sp. 90]|uniref:hypothetical protein n=1 Tax=unclassified Flavobacterium TaxID=196869 RepID=UPI000EB49ED7|nr:MULTISPECIES: hypothetical protein [unclassified Flavobacterium]RKR10685.1 hypothetical protein C8C82_2669 [Flavobacterium sp. 81]TCK54468.1 hypothetical protein C8C83_2364 [Flavobacterium sp. 90]